MKFLDSKVHTIAAKWFYVLNYAKEMKEIPSQLTHPQELTDALHVLEQGAWTEEEFDVYLAELDDWRCRESQQETAEEKGFERGLERGIQKGVEQGIEKGIEQVAKKMLQQGLDDIVVAQVTGLSIDVIKNLK